MKHVSLFIIIFLVFGFHGIQTDYKPDCNGTQFPVVSLHDYEKVKKLGNGTFGVVSLEKEVRTGHLFAIKRITKPDFNLTGKRSNPLNDYYILKSLSPHPNIIQVKGISYDRCEKYGLGKECLSPDLVFPYYKNGDLLKYIRSRFPVMAVVHNKPAPLIVSSSSASNNNSSQPIDNAQLGKKDESDSTSSSEEEEEEGWDDPLMVYLDESETLIEQDPGYKEEIKRFMRQILEALAHLHDHHILHRDLKPANILLDDTQTTALLTDFGYALDMKNRGVESKQLSFRVGTKSYRAPEIHCQQDYSYSSDVFSAGLIFSDFFLGKPLFFLFRRYYNLENDNLSDFFEYLYAAESSLNWNPMRVLQRRMGEDAFDLFQKMIQFDWISKRIPHRRRISAIEALKHPYFCDSRIDEL